MNIGIEYFGYNQFSILISLLAFLSCFFLLIKVNKLNTIAIKNINDIGKSLLSLSSKSQPCSALRELEIPFIEWDITSDIFTISDEAYYICGYDPQSFDSSYNNWLKKIHPDDQAMFVSALNKYINNQTMKNTIAYRMLMPNRNEIWLKMELRRLPTHNQRHEEKIVGLIFDLTDKYRDINDYESVKNKYEVLQGSIDESILVITETSLIIEANKQAERMLSHDNRSVVGQKLSNIAHIKNTNGNADIVIEPVINMFSTLFVDMSKAYSLQTLQGSRKSVLLTISSIEHYAEDRVYMLLLKDISDLDLTRSQLRQARKMEALGQLTGGVAHDLNNILGGILGSVEILGKHLNNNETAEKFYNLSLESITRGAELTGRLLALTRKEDDYFKDIDMAELLDSSISLYGNLSKAGADIKIHYSPESRIVKGNSALLETVILNLLINASHSMQDKGVIHVDMTDKMIEGSGFFCISIADSGVGISDEIRDSIFQPYFTTKPAEQGTGMGLAMALSVVEHHDGHIFLDSTPGKGSTFSVCLPKSCYHPNKPVTEVRRTKQIELSQTRATSQKTVLIVDDERDMREIMSTFAADVGLNVVLAGDGNEAIALLSGPETIDLVVLDIIMPNMNGADCYEVISSRWPELPVVICSGYIPPNQRRKLGRLDDSCFIAKPFSKDDWTSTITRLSQ